MKKYILVLLCIAGVNGCVSIKDTETMMREMYNIPSSGVSQFDGTKYIRVSSISCSPLQFELYQDTQKAKKGYVLLNAGAQSISNIGAGKSLHLKIDESTYSFESSDLVTEHESAYMGYGVSRHYSHKTYVVPERVIREAAASKLFLVKMNLLNNTYIEGRCTPLTLQEASKNNIGTSYKVTQEHVNLSNEFSGLSGFRKFVDMIGEEQW